MKTSQAWSIDIIIAILLFVGVIFAFYWIVSGGTESKEEELKKDATIVLENLNITEDISQIDELREEDYQDLKRKLRVENEFCVYFEDEEGNLVYIDPDDADLLGIGSEEIKIDDKPCGIPPP